MTMTRLPLTDDTLIKREATRTAECCTKRGGEIRRRRRRKTSVRAREPRRRPRCASALTCQPSRRRAPCALVDTGADRDKLCETTGGNRVGDRNRSGRRSAGEHTNRRGNTLDTQRRVPHELPVPWRAGRRDAKRPKCPGKRSTPIGRTFQCKQCFREQACRPRRTATGTWRRSARKGSWAAPG